MALNRAQQYATTTTEPTISTLERKLTTYAQRVAKELVTAGRPQTPIPGHTKVEASTVEQARTFLGVPMGHKQVQASRTVATLHGWLITTRHPYHEEAEIKAKRWIKEEDDFVEYWLAADGRLLHRAYEDYRVIDSGQIGRWTRDEETARPVTRREIGRLDLNTERGDNNPRRRGDQHVSSWGEITTSSWCDEWGIGLSKALTTLRRSTT